MSDETIGKWLMMGVCGLILLSLLLEAHLLPGSHLLSHVTSG